MIFNQYFFKSRKGFLFATTLLEFRTTITNDNQIIINNETITFR